MKKQKRGQFLIGVAMLLIACGWVAYRVINLHSTPSKELAPEARVAAILESGGCLSCHSANPELPFYANIPVAGDMVMADVEEGYRAFSMEGIMQTLQNGGTPNPVDVAKIEKVALDKRMPMAKYYLVHWGSQMTDEKASVIAEWARDYRTAYYNDGLTGERAGEPVRPIIANADVDQRKVALGFNLYHDTRLSVDNTVS
ncbi:MAG: heme-binding domain-containing protein, partial [Prevotella sp.]|nr:heme-binding domain-containing protein [Prevotella sp.]